MFCCVNDSCNIILKKKMFSPYLKCCVPIQI